MYQWWVASLAEYQFVHLQIESVILNMLLEGVTKVGASKMLGNIRRRHRAIGHITLTSLDFI
jgi:hypothetical protein